MSATAATIEKEKPTGLEDVVRSVRTLARSIRGVGEDAASILERELAMAINISEQIRDEVVSEKALESAREEALPARG